MEVKNVKGTHDILFEEAKQYTHVESVMQHFAYAFGFDEIRIPVIEHSELFVRGVGEGSDIVRKEMYTFLDKGDRSITLRPEFTAGIIRSFVQNKMYANNELPVKLFYLGPTFRYERPQLGRYRQFNQFGVEAIGANQVATDAEVISLAYAILSLFGFKDNKIKINSLGDEETRKNYKKALKDYFAAHIENMCEDCKSRYELNPLRILDCKVPSDQEIVKNAPKLSDYLSESSKKRFEELQSYLDALEIPYEVDESLVRGLDYYSEVVFEFHAVSKTGKDYGAIGAGGHYDKLVEELGGPSIPGVGFSFGIERVVSVLQDDGYFEKLSMINDGIYIMPLGEKAKIEGLYLATRIRLFGFRVDICHDDVKLGAMFKRAIKKDARFAIIIGEEEIKNKTVQIKNLQTQEQVSINNDDIISFLENEYLKDKEEVSEEN